MLEINEDPEQAAVYFASKESANMSRGCGVKILKKIWRGSRSFRKSGGGRGIADSGVSVVGSALPTQGDDTDNKSLNRPSSLLSLL